MANRRIHDLEDTATTLDSGAYIAVDSDSYTAAKKFAADKLPDPTGATDGYVWTADGADGAAWEAVSTISDEKLRGWAAELPQLMTSVTRTDYSDGIQAGWIQVTGTVTWPDGTTGHLDGVEYPDDTGRLQYFTASHEASGKIAVQSPLIDGAAGITIITPDYYVDSAASAGGDGSLSAPYDALTDLSGLLSGDVVALKSGSTFSETLTAVAGVSYYRYGAGAKPIIDAGQTISGTWIQDGTYTNTWYQDVTVELSLTSYIQLLADADMPTRAASVAALDSASGQFYATPDTGSGDTTVRIHIHPGGVNPNSSGVVYRCPRRLYSVNGTDTDDLTVDGILTQLSASNNGSLRVGNDAALRHCDAYYGGKHNLFVKDGSAVHGCRAIGARYNTSYSLFIYNEDSPGGAGLTFADCAMIASSLDSDATGINGHVNASGTFGDVIYSRLYTQDLGIAVAETPDADSIKIKRNYSLNCTKFIQSSFDGSEVIDCGVRTSATNARPIALNTATSLTVRGGYIWCESTTNAGMVYSAAAGTLTFIDVLFYKPATDSQRRAFYANNASLTLIFYNCKFYLGGAFDCVYAPAVGTVLSNGSHLQTDGGFDINGTDYTTLAAYVAATGNDVAGIIGGVDTSRLGL